MLRPEVYDFYAGGSGREVTLRANVVAWQGVPLLPRVLRDVSAVAAALRGSPAGVYADGGIRLAHAMGLGRRRERGPLEDVAARHGCFLEVRQGTGLGIP